MRPAGEIREALRSAFAERSSATWREVLPSCPVNLASPAEVMLVRRTVENMVRAGELEQAGKSKAEGSRIWRTMYELTPRGGATGLADMADAPWCGSAAECMDMLQDVTRGWLDTGA